jgi:hypothetical protein
LPVHREFSVIPPGAASGRFRKTSNPDRWNRPGSPEPDDQKFLPDHPQWFGWPCILGGPVLLILLGQHAELPATRYPEQPG